MRYFKFPALVVLTIGLIFVGGRGVYALGTTTSPPEPVYGDIFVSALSVGNDDLNSIELYNSSDQPVDMSHWQVVRTVDVSGGQVVCDAIPMEDYVLPGDYAVLALESSTTYQNDATGNVQPFDLCDSTATGVVSISLVKDGQTMEIVSSPPSGDWMRKGLTKTYRTNDFTHDFTTFSRAGNSLYADAWYTPPTDNRLQFMEVLNHPRDCSPLDNSKDCADYVKVYNPTTTVVDLANYRLRVGYRGDNATASNTFSLSGLVQPGQAVILQNAADGSPISLTNTGGYVWFEDAWGVKRYDASVQQFADASSSTHQGESWAYSTSDDAWKWAEPSPNSVENHFVLTTTTSSSSASDTSTSTLVPCRSDQYRSPETNRCRSINSSTTSSLVPCKPGQIRNPETNRCRSVGTSATSLTPCKEGYVRNAETNRCRKDEGVQGDSIVDPTTNPAAIDASRASPRVAIIVGIMALSYGVWEYRDEIGRCIRRVRKFASKSGKST